MKISCVSVIRNEADLVLQYLNQIEKLFDSAYIVDVSSTDGTYEIIKDFKSTSSKSIKLFRSAYREVYYDEIITHFSKIAFEESADWVFALNASEFLGVKDRKELVEFLEKSCCDLIRLPLIALAPSKLGGFDDFRFDQEFFFNGRDVEIEKMAISRRYSIINPHFSWKGDNQKISKNYGASEEPSDCSVRAFPLYHIPVRSLERFYYQISTINSNIKETKNFKSVNYHYFDDIMSILDGISRDHSSDALVNFLALFYGLAGNKKKIKDVIRSKKKIACPEYFITSLPKTSHIKFLEDVIKQDQSINWKETDYFPGMIIRVTIRGEEIELQPAAIRWRNFIKNTNFQRLNSDHVMIAESLNLPEMIKKLAYASLSVQAKYSVNWSGIRPLAATILELTRPRRLVMLGCDKGGEFFTFCEAINILELETECVAVDAWCSEIYSNNENNFNEFRSIYNKNYNKHYILRSSLQKALNAFDDGSIDLLLLNMSQHSVFFLNYVESWLAKLSNNGMVVTFGDNNLFNRSKLSEISHHLCEKFPTIKFRNHHSHGLSIHYLGSEKNSISDLFSLISSNENATDLIEIFLDNVGSKHTTVINDSLSVSSQAVQGLIEGVKIFIRDNVPYSRNLWHFFKFKIREIKSFNIKPAHLKHNNVSNGLFFSQEAKSPRKIESNFGNYILYKAEMQSSQKRRGLHNDIRLVVPTRGCSKWLPYFLEAYSQINITPTYAVDANTEEKTLEIIKQHSADLIFVDNNKIPNGESIMPFLSKSISENYIFRLDDDEFPSDGLLKFINSIPESDYRFVDSWWLPRFEVAMINGKLRSCHPRWLNVQVGKKIYENLHGGRFYRHREVTYSKVGPHHGNFGSDYVSHAPRDALIFHLDYLVRSPAERLQKIRSVEQRFPGNGWPFANHMIPEMAPLELLNVRDFSYQEVVPLIEAIMQNIYNNSDELGLTTTEISNIQKDRLTSNLLHLHYY